MNRASKEYSALEQAIDDLALKAMVKGAAAFRSKSFAEIPALARACEHIALAEELQALAKTAKAKQFTDEDAANAVCRLQVQLKETALLQVTSVLEDPAPIHTSFEEDPELLGDFVLEADEHLASIEERILLLEKDPTLIDSIHAVFRSFHSIKGLAGFLGLDGVQAIAHEVETLLDHARNLRVSVDSVIVDLVLESSEYLKQEVAVVRARLAGAALPAVCDTTSLKLGLSKANARAAAPDADTDLESVPEPAAIPDAPITPLLDEPAALVPVAAQAINPAPPATPVAETRPPAPAPALGPSAPVAPRGSRTEAASSSIRVETSKLDRLMDMVGEMVIAQSILTTLTHKCDASESRLVSEVSQLARITTEVQRCAMSMRMMPIGPLFQKNAKLVRDLARRHRKLVSLDISGESTELDKSIAEELADPLLHMIRNAVDHGIELPEDRVAAGKNPTAELRISAEHLAGQIVITISDDGRGLDPARLRKKAIERGLIDESTHLSEGETFHLIFAPGFSTAETVTDLSGRGVGMDVVRQHVESLRGRIEIESKLGQGTTFLIHLPLTLAIIEGLVIVVGEQRYIIPLFSVREMLRPTQDMLFTARSTDEMILMRGSLLPLIRLHKRFAITPRSGDICDGLLVVCEFSGKRFCLFVDDLLGRQEVVIKSLDAAFKCVSGLAGSAILGDGGIGLILDVEGIFRSSNLEKEGAAA